LKISAWELKSSQKETLPFPGTVYLFLGLKVYVLGSYARRILGMITFFLGWRCFQEDGFNSWELGTPSESVAKKHP
jgi:hypothetical protein